MGEDDFLEMLYEDCNGGCVDLQDVEDIEDNDEDLED